MFKLAFLLLFAGAYAKLTKPKYDYLLFEQFNRVEDLTLPVRKGVGESAWVLSLNEDVESLKLRVVTGDEVREVFGSRSGPSPRRRRVKKDDPNKQVSSSTTLDATQTHVDEKAMISDIMRVINKFAPSPRRRRVKKDDPNKRASPSTTLDTTQTHVDEKAMISEIMRVINKFALTTHAEPDGYLVQNADEAYPSLKLYFQGEHTSLVLKAVGRQWHYVIGPPALFPEWFYEDHPTAADSRGIFAAVPKTVQREFYSTLHRMLTTLLRFPM